MTDLEHVRSALIAMLGDVSRLPMINARLILRTGVSLSKIDPRLSQDLTRVGKVLMALREMGYDLELQRK